MSNDVRPLSRRRDEGERRKKIYEPRDRRRVSLCRSSRVARARDASDHPSIARAFARSVVPNVRSFHPRSPRCRTYGGLEDVGRCYRVREWCFPMDGILLNGIRTQNHLRGGRWAPPWCRHLTSTPGGLTTSGDSRKLISDTRARISRAISRAPGARPARARSVAGGGVEKISSHVRRGKGDRPVARARAIAIARASSWLRARWAGWTRWTGWGGRSRIHTRSSRARRRRR